MLEALLRVGERDEGEPRAIILIAFTDAGGQGTTDRAEQARGAECDGNLGREPLRFVERLWDSGEVNVTKQAGEFRLGFDDPAIVIVVDDCEFDLRSEFSLLKGCWGRGGHEAEATTVRRIIRTT